MKTDVSALEFIDLLPEVKDFDPSLFKLIDDFVYLPTSSAELIKAIDQEESGFQFELIDSYVVPKKDEFEWVDIPNISEVKTNQHVQSLLDSPFDKANWWKIAIKGFPNEMRGEIWSYLVDSESYLLKEKYISLLNKKADIQEKIIELDVKRTFSYIPKFTESQGPRLYNVLKAYSLYDEEVGYCQGINYLAGTLLLYIPDEAVVFCVLANLMERFKWRQLYIKGMPKLVEILNKLSKEIERRLPELHKYLEDCNVNIFGVLSHLFITAYMYSTPFDFAIRIFELFLVAGEQVLVECTMSIITLMKDRIMQHTIIDIHGYIKNGMVRECYIKHGTDFIISTFSDLN